MKSNTQSTHTKNAVALSFAKSERHKKRNPRVTHLRELFKTKLKTIYGLENDLIKLIPKIINNARSMELVNALEIHLMVSKDQVRRLEAVFELMHIFPGKQKSTAASALIKQVNEELLLTGETMVRDAGIILTVQQLIHFNIVLYGSLFSFAQTLGEYEVASVLADGLEEEKNSDRDLSQIAEIFVNPVAAGGYRHENVMTLQSKIIMN